MRPLFRTMILALILTALPLIASAGDPFLYAGDGNSGTLYKIDKATGATLTTIPVTLGGTQVTWIKGLAAEPVSGDLYAVVGDFVVAEGGDPEGIIVFKLATIAPDTGIATEIGTLSDRFSGLAWVVLPPTEGIPMGIDALMGVTGDGAATPETLFVIDHFSASTSLFMPLGNGTSGEAIAFNTSDNMLYHLSGRDVGVPMEGSLIVFERIDLTTMTITDIPLSGTPIVNGNGLTFDASTGQFLVSGTAGIPGTDGPGGAPLFSLSTTGVAVANGLTDTFFGGMGFSDQVPVELQRFSVE